MSPSHCHPLLPEGPFRLLWSQKELLERAELETSGWELRDVLRQHNEATPAAREG